MNKFMRAGFSIMGLALAAALPARADEVAMRPYIGESLMYTIADSHRHSDDGIGGILGGGIPINELFNIEVDGAYSHFNNDSKQLGSAPWTQYLSKLDGQFFFSRDPEFAPYFGLGAGYAKNVLKNGGHEGSFFGDAGVGAIHYFKLFSADLGVRGDVRYRWTDINKSKFPGRGVDSFGEPVFSIGVVLPLAFGGGGGEQAEPEHLPPPSAQQPAQNLAGANRRFEDVHFAFDKYNLTEYAKAGLDSDATSINKLSSTYPSLKVDIAGHTDWIGTDAYNQALSERRATAVKDYLVRKGVDAGRIRTYAYGESQPVAPNTTAEGRALNRRTEISTKGQ